jgi:hypothetical protein
MRGRAAAALAGYVVLSVWLTWPLAAHLTTHLPDTHDACHYDLPFTGWLFAWESHVLATAPAHFADANIYHPTPHPLLYGPTAIGALPYFAPTFLASGDPALALNVLLLGSVALTAWVLHLVVLGWTGSHTAGFLAAWTWLTNRWVLWEFVPTAPSYGLLLYFPLIMRATAAPAASFAAALRVLPLLVLQELIHFGYIAPATLGPVAALGVVRALRPTTRAAGLRLLGVVAIAALFLVPEYAGYQVVQRENPHLAEQTLWRGLAQPETNLPWGLLDFQAPTAIAPVALLLIALGGVSFLLAHRQRAGDTRRAWSQAAWWTVVGAAMSLTPTVRWFGEPVRQPLFWVIEWVPLLGRLRVPGRLGLAAFMGLAVLAGLAFAECERRLPARLRSGSKGRVGTALLIALGMYYGYAHGYGRPVYLRKPLPASYPIAPAILESNVTRRLRAPGGPVLDLPVGPGGVLPLWHTRAMYRSIFHWRPLVNGYDSYWPEAFPERMALAARLPDAEALAALRAETGLEMILVHLNELGDAERAAWQAVGDGGRRDLRLETRDGDDVLFAVSPVR